MSAESAAGEPDVRARGEVPITLHPCAGGPLLVRGAAEVVDPDGTRHPTTRPVSAVCRCGASGLRPWCDGTHKVLARRAGRAAAGPTRD